MCNPINTHLVLCGLSHYLIKTVINCDAARRIVDDPFNMSMLVWCELLGNALAILKQCKYIFNVMISCMVLVPMSVCIFGDLKKN